VIPVAPSWFCDTAFHYVQVSHRLKAFRPASKLLLFWLNYPSTLTQQPSIIEGCWSATLLFYSTADF